MQSKGNDSQRNKRSEVGSRSNDPPIVAEPNKVKRYTVLVTTYRGEKIKTSVEATSSTAAKNEARLAARCEGKPVLSSEVVT